MEGKEAGCRICAKAGCRVRLGRMSPPREGRMSPEVPRQDVAVRVCVHKNTVSLLSLTLPGCRQAASDRPAERRCKRWSGRRGSNPRQPAWKAGTLPPLLRVLWASFLFRLKSFPSCLIGSGHASRQVITWAKFALLRLHIDIIQMHIVLHSTNILVP